MVVVTSPRPYHITNKWVKVVSMVTATSFYTATLGSRTRKLRLSLGVTQQELAGLSGVSKESISSFEHNLPIILDARRRILKELWAIKANRLPN